ncbi:catalase [Tuwongella immobilis]|uniref:Catalase n=1 Tax=Tuwongella immobilis TaxID=692036 RepID=A0A6C2YTU3_9BACT|nr:catalase [Tuwongella immobilis]VIP05060.1 catalase : Probable catalase hydroperoxidase hpii oxidoreductase protein OS=Blastopirellula marina DSM 3645 GN=DSM3645_04750 PE=4 SV=1: Catalase: Catalase-rel [Tuwongella immobilis]VTS07476.1 catalase : Probable catalase hydroperoxidase hpii oxidoreductase protein OS=Blastopirellula marina DSM 3645 GN=DSM3645_04750 PE=4 SV=1: Catalase: Catalase-rel [Tuwongella immobilis]
MNLKRSVLSAVAALATTSAFAQESVTPPVTAPRVPLTEDGGQPVGNNQHSRTAGERGPVLLDNFHLIQKLARFDRERIPERVVHARGVGAHGEFVSYGNFSEFTKAKLLSEKGKKTAAFVRFSTVIHPNGSPEQLRDPRGFAVKLYTEEGNWDIVGNNLPVFFIRDAMKFPDMVHSLKPSPVTNQQDPNRFFDFFSHVPEATHMLTFVFSDQGTPKNLRQMDGFGVHAFKWVNAQGDVHYVKFTWHSLQGHATDTAAEAATASAANHSGHSADLYDAIRKGEFPSWELRVQLLKPSDLEKFEFDPLDATKVWPNVPEIKVGKLTLNRVPDNFFQFTEQAAFSPGMVVPGVEPSEDRLLQGRLFSYADTQRYRMGANYLMLPVNRPYAAVHSNNQDGSMNFGQTASDVNYEPSRTNGSRRDDAEAEYSKAPLTGGIQQQRIRKTDNFRQAGDRLRAMSKSEHANFLANLAGDLGKVRDVQTRIIMVSYFFQADPATGEALAKAVDVSMEAVHAAVVAQAMQPTSRR